MRQRILRPPFLTKYAAAFSKMLRCSVTRLSSALRRRTSADPLGAGALISVWPAYQAPRTQLYSVCFGRPRRATTFSTVNPRCITCLIASAANSSVYRVLLIGTFRCRELWPLGVYERLSGSSADSLPRCDPRSLTNQRLADAAFRSGQSQFSLWS